MIDKISNIASILETKKNKSVSSVNESKRNDSIQISSEAQKAAENAIVSNIVKETPDVRLDRVQEIKAKIADGSYNFDDNKILEMVADRIADSLLRR